MVVQLTKKRHCSYDNCQRYRSDGQLHNVDKQKDNLSAVDTISVKPATQVFIETSSSTISDQEEIPKKNPQFITKATSKEEAATTENFI